MTAAFIYLWNTNEEFKEFFLSTWENIKETFSGIIDTISEHVITVFESLKEFWNNNIETFLEVAETVFTGIWETVEVAMEIGRASCREREYRIEMSVVRRRHRV